MDYDGAPHDAAAQIGFESKAWKAVYHILVSSAEFQALSTRV
jgi:hypothetical protein